MTWRPVEAKTWFTACAISEESMCQDRPGIEIEFEIRSLDKINANSCASSGNSFKHTYQKLTIQSPGKVDLIVEKSSTLEHNRFALVHLDVLWHYGELELIASGERWGRRRPEKRKFKLVTTHTKFPSRKNRTLLARSPPFQSKLTKATTRTTTGCRRRRCRHHHHHHL